MTNPHPTRPAACSRGPGLCRRSNTEARSHLMNALPPLAAGPRPRRPLQHATPTAQDDDGAGRSDGSTLDHTWPSLPRPVQAIDSCADPSAEVGKRSTRPTRPNNSPGTDGKAATQTGTEHQNRGSSVRSGGNRTRRPEARRDAPIGGGARDRQTVPSPQPQNPKHKAHFSDVQKGPVVNLEEPEIPGGWL